MLRPERMSKVSVTGSKTVMDDVVETLHDEHVLHLSDYDGSWAGFAPGDPAEGADEASETLVTVRSLESILEVDADDAGPSRLVTDEAIATELEEIREEVNTLDDRRDDLESELQSVRGSQETMEPFADLGIDLDLLGGYETLDVHVVEGAEDVVREALAEADGIGEFELFTGDGVVAAFARPTDDAGAEPLVDALVGVEVTELEIPDVEDVAAEHGGRLSPEAYIEELEHREQTLRSRLESVESEIEDVKLDAAGFLLAVEEKLSIDVQKREAPLSFATTEHSFVAEGWVPADEYDELAATLEEAVAGHVEVEELEQVDFERYERAHAHGDHDDEEGKADGDGATATEADGDDVTADGGSDPEVAADGGTTDGEVVSMHDEPPVLLDNPKPASPFELLVDTVARPLYGEFDPTVILWLTFPLFYGFMIGDVGYGLLYTAAGYVLWRRFESDAIRSLGGIAMWAGGFTIVFGVLYGELFGLHVVGEWYGGPVIEKGLSPASVEWARLWLIMAAVAGLVHMTIGFVLDFARNLAVGVREAVLQGGSRGTLYLGVWVWVFSRAAAPAKPDLVYEVFAGHPLELGFTGFPAALGWGGLALAGVAFVGVVLGEMAHFGAVGVAVALFEWTINAFVNVLSYARLAAVLLAKAGMAFVVNLLFFGVYVTGEGSNAAWHFALTHMPHVGDMTHGHEVTSIMFPGLVHMGPVGAVGGVAVFVLGHLLVLGLGVTSAGLQAIRLEYVEFFNKFYDGGGAKYNPFGYDRTFTTEDDVK